MLKLREVVEDHTKSWFQTGHKAGPPDNGVFFYCTEGQESESREYISPPPLCVSLIYAYTCTQYQKKRLNSCSDIVMGR